jgi:hypothetical protein
VTAPWAKWDGLAVPYPVLAHTLDTAAVAAVLYRSVLSQPIRDLFIETLGWERATAEQHFAWLAGSHDLGKVGPLHQGQLLSRAAGRFASFLTVLALPEPRPGRCCGTRR